MHPPVQNMPDGAHHKIFCRSVLTDLRLFNLIDTQDHPPAHRPVQLFFHLCLIIRDLIIRKDINIESGNASRLLQTVFHKTGVIHTQLCKIQMILRIRIDSLKKILFPAFFLCDPKEFFIIFSRHSHINIIVPGNKSLMTHRSEQRSERHEIAQMIFFTDFDIFA